MNLTAMHNDFHQRSGARLNNANDFLAAGLLYILGYYVTQWSNNFVLTLTCNSKQSCIFYNDLYDKLFASWHEWPIQLVNVQKSQRIRTEGIRHNNLIFTESSASFLEADLNSYTSQYNYNEHYYILLQHHNDVADLPQEMTKIFEYCWRYDLINCVVQVQNAKGEILIYTYFPFGLKHCGSVEIVLINQFNGSSMVNKELFPKKLKNFYGCPLRVATWNVPPFLILSNNSKGELTVTGGFEGLLLEVLSNRLNFTLDIKVPENDNQRGIIMANGSLTGAMKMLHERHVDLSIGAYRPAIERSAIATLTINYYQSPISVVAVEDIYLLTSMQTLLFPFSCYTWFLILSMIILAMGFVASLKRVFKRRLPKDIGKGNMDVILMLMGLPALYRPAKVATRIFNIFWMMYALLVRTIYEALLFHMIRTHITIDAPQHLEELATHGYSMVMNGLAADLMSKIPALKTTNIITLNSSSDTSAMEFLDSLPLEEAKQYVGALSLDFIRHYVQSKRKEGYFRILPFDVVFLKICIYLPKHSYFIEQLNETLIWLQGFGIIDGWARFVQDRRYHIGQTNHKDRVFGFAQLKMSFVLLMVGHLVAMLVLVLELLYKKITRDKHVNPK